MQHLQLQLQKLDKPPVPESLDDFLFVQTSDKRKFCVKAVEDGLIKNKFIFPIEFHRSNMYGHIKVSAEPEPEFKVGDRVKVNDCFSDDTFTITHIDTKEGIATLDNEGGINERLIICYHLSDLTPVPNEN